MDTKVIKPGVVETGRRIKGGFNLNKFVKELLRSMGFAVTEDCCTYYPTFPILDVEDYTSPTNAEVAANNVPNGGFFLTTNTETYRLWVVVFGSASLIATNN